MFRLFPFQALKWKCAGRNSGTHIQTESSSLLRLIDGTPDDFLCHPESQQQHLEGPESFSQLLVASLATLLQHSNFSCSRKGIIYFSSVNPSGILRTSYFPIFPAKKKVFYSPVTVKLQSLID